MSGVELGDAVENRGFDLRDAVVGCSENLERDVFGHGREEEGLVGVVEGEDGAVERVRDSLSLGEDASELGGECEGHSDD